MENLKQPCLTGWLTGFNSPCAGVCVCVSAALAWSVGVSPNVFKKNNNVKENKCNVIKAGCAGAYACVHIKECVEESCRGVDQSVQQGSGLMALKRSGGTGHVFPR